jgi:hypothetical protein
MTARTWSQQPTRFNIYEDLSGRQYVLLEEIGLRGMWIALRLNGTTALTMLSASNIEHLVLIGRASFDSTPHPSQPARVPQSQAVL